MRSLETNPINQIRLYILTSGFLGVSSIALSTMEWLPMHQTAQFIVLPAYIFVAIIGFQFREIGQHIVKGFIYGVIAVALYDLSRLPFLLVGWTDFIPNIGKWLLNSDQANGFIGYFWRYFLNGGGLGISFMMLIRVFNIRRRHLVLGLLYGFAIFMGLVITLLFAPKGEHFLFEITKLSFTGGLIGHLIFGVTLGYFTKNIHSSDQRNDYIFKAGTSLISSASNLK